MPSARATPSAHPGVGISGNAEPHSSGAASLAALVATQRHGAQMHPATVTSAQNGASGLIATGGIALIAARTAEALFDPDPSAECWYHQGRTREPFSAPTYAAV